MSLFVVIKYSGTDLDSERALDDLPDELFEMYRIAAYTHFGNQLNMWRVPRDEQISGMASSWAEQDDVDAGYHVKQLIFNKVLKEYDELI